jgi:glycine betaine/proline transport system substrate-binding protein
MKTLRKLLISSVLAFAAIGLLAGQAMAANKPSLRIGYVQGWPSSVITTKIAAQVIENKLGNHVKLLSLSAGPMYQGVVSGDLDAHLTAWLPKTHAKYYNKMWEKVINLGPNLLGTKLGIAVPQYMKDINSIKDLKKSKVADKLNHKIIGVGSGAGININTKEAIKKYGLDMKLVPSSTAAMGAALKKATNSQKPIAVTGWKPLWIWSKFKLKMLKDPKNVYGHSGRVNTLVNPSLPNKAPKVYTFLRRYSLTMDDLNGIEAAKQKGTSTKQAISDWLKKHQDKVKGWTYGLTGSSS